MAYTKPFTELQRQEATRKYRSFRRHYKSARNDYPPENRFERRSLRDYRDAVKSFGLELNKPLAWIRPESLYELEQNATTAMVNYLALWMLGRHV